MPSCCPGLQHYCTASSSFYKKQAKVCLPLQKHAYPCPLCGKVSTHTVSLEWTEATCLELQTDALDLEKDVDGLGQTSPHAVS